MSKRILVTSTDLMMIQFLVPHIIYLSQNGFDVDIACSDVGGRMEDVKDKLQNWAKSIYVVRLHRSPVNIDNFNGYKDMKRVIDLNNYDIIWTNEPVMGVVTRLAAKKSRKHGAKVLYMVHGFHFFKGSSTMSWLVYYPIERIMAHFADALVTINKEDYQRGQTFAFKNVYYIHGIGLDTKKFRDAVVDRKKKRIEFGIPNDSIMLFSVGELGTRKNHEVVIRALGELKNSAIHYVICGEGVLESKLKNLCKELGIAENVHFLGYRKDIAELCKTADIYVFPSQREGLGIGALEGMASGLPLISSYVNGIRDYTENEKTGFTCNPHDVDQFKDAISILAQDKVKRKTYGEYNSKSVLKYDVNETKEEVLKIMEEILNN